MSVSTVRGEGKYKSVWQPKCNPSLQKLIVFVQPRIYRQYIKTWRCKSGQQGHTGHINHTARAPTGAPPASGLRNGRERGLPLKDMSLAGHGCWLGHNGVPVAPLWRSRQWAERDEGREAVWKQWKPNGQPGWRVILFSNPLCSFQTLPRWLSLFHFKSKLSRYAHAMSHAEPTSQS